MELSRSQKAGQKKPWRPALVVLATLVAAGVWFKNSRHQGSTQMGSYGDLQNVDENSATANTPATSSSTPAKSEKEKRSTADDGKRGHNFRAFRLVDLERRYNSKFSLEDVEGGTTSFRLSGKIPKATDDEEPSVSGALGFVSEVAPLLSIDHPEQLENPLGKLEPKTLGPVAVLAQTIDGADGEKIPVEGGMVRVHYNSADGSVFMINSNFVGEIPPNLDTRFVVSAAEASAEARTKALELSSAAIARQDAPIKVVYRFREGGVGDAIAWKIILIQPELGDKGSGIFFVLASAKNRPHVERINTALR